MRVLVAIARFGLVSLIFPFAICMRMLEGMSDCFLWVCFWKVVFAQVIALGFWCGRYAGVTQVVCARRYQPLRIHFFILLSVPVGILLWSLVCIQALFFCCAADLCGQYELGEGIYHHFKIMCNCDSSFDDISMADVCARKPDDYAPALAALVKEYGASSQECLWFKSQRCDYYYQRE